MKGDTQMSNKQTFDINHCDQGAGLQRSTVYARIKEMLGSRRLEKRYNKARGMEELQLKRAPLTPDEIELQEALKDFSTSAVQIQKEH